MKKMLIAAAAALSAAALTAPGAYAEQQRGDGWQNQNPQNGGEDHHRRDARGQAQGPAQGQGQGQDHIQRQAAPVQWQHGGGGGNGGGDWRRGGAFTPPQQHEQVQAEWNHNNGAGNGGDHRWRGPPNNGGQQNWQNHNPPPQVETWRGGDNQRRDWNKPDNARDDRNRGDRGNQWTNNDHYDGRRDDPRYDRYRNTHRDFDHPRFSDWRNVPRGGYFDDGYARIVGGYYHHNYYWWSYGGWDRPYRRWEVGYILPDYLDWEPLPYDLYYELPPAPYGCRYVMVDGDILLIALSTGIILDALMYY